MPRRREKRAWKKKLLTAQLVLLLLALVWLMDSDSDSDSCSVNDLDQKDQKVIENYIRREKQNKENLK